MATLHQIIEKRREVGRVRGLKSAGSDSNTRLQAALEYGPNRSIESYLVFEIRTFNPRTKQRHLLEIRHDPGDGNDRYSVYLDGDRWHKPWSRWGFCRWLFKQIDSVRSDWE